MIAIVDADSIYFQAAAAAKNKKYKLAVRKYIDVVMRRISRDLLEPAAWRVAVKGHGNFRKDIYPEYKAHRKELPEDLKERLDYGYWYMVDKYDAMPADHAEADDYVSIWGHEAREYGLNYCIIGIDKDLKQIPGKHYNFRSGKFTDVDERTAHYNLMHQCITGDSSDNIPGIPKVGPVGARKLLGSANPNDMWDIVCRFWHSRGIPNPELSYRLLAMIRTWDEYEEIKNKLDHADPLNTREKLWLHLPNHKPDYWTEIYREEELLVDKADTNSRKETTADSEAAI